MLWSKKENIFYTTQTYLRKLGTILHTWKNTVLYNSDFLWKTVRRIYPISLSKAFVWLRKRKRVRKYQTAKERPFYDWTVRVVLYSGHGIILD